MIPKELFGSRTNLGSVVGIRGYVFDGYTNAAQRLRSASEDLNACFEAHGRGTFSVDEKYDKVNGFQVVALGELQVSPTSHNYWKKIDNVSPTKTTIK